MVLGRWELIDMSLSLRIAIVDLDWDHVKAVDILAVLRLVHAWALRG